MYGILTEIRNFKCEYLNFRFELKATKNHNLYFIGGDNVKSIWSHTLTIKAIELRDTGYYTCHYPNEHGKRKLKTIFMQSVVTPRVALKSPEEIKIINGSNETVTIHCVFEAYPMYIFINLIRWEKLEVVENQVLQKYAITQLNNTFVNTSITFSDISEKNNGSYSCSMLKSVDDFEKIGSNFSLLILSKPMINVTFVRAVGASKIFLNWTANYGNDPSALIFVQYQESGTDDFLDYWEKLKSIHSFYTLVGFKSNTQYKLRVSVQNGVGSSLIIETDWIQTLQEDPNFIPDIQIIETTHKSVTLGWKLPPPELIEYFQYYELVFLQGVLIVQKKIYPDKSNFLIYTTEKLKKSTEYIFTVRGCSELTGECGSWSKDVTTRTNELLDIPDISYKPNIEISDISGTSITIKWEPPAEEVLDYLDFYELYIFQTCFSGVFQKEVIAIDNPLNQKTVENLNPTTIYFFEMRACNEVTSKCGPFSHTLRNSTLSL